MADQSGPKPEASPVLSLERQAEVLRTLMLNVADRVSYLTNWGGKDTDDVQFVHGKAIAEIARIKGMIASGVAIPELKGTSWAVVESSFLSAQATLVAKKFISEPKAEKKG